MYDLGCLGRVTGRPYSGLASAHEPHVGQVEVFRPMPPLLMERAEATGDRPSCFERSDNPEKARQMSSAEANHSKESMSRGSVDPWI